jgi:hypothetical protein
MARVIGVAAVAGAGVEDVLAPLHGVRGLPGRKRGIEDREQKQQNCR